MKRRPNYLFSQTAFYLTSSTACRQTPIKLQFFGHNCRMKDARMLKAIVFGVMEGKTRKGRPCREWTDDITDWCKEDLHMHWDGRQPTGLSGRGLLDVQSTLTGHLAHPVKQEEDSLLATGRLYTGSPAGSEL